jgi:aerobic-type carbon monoxide dehydrogenase small subunit (CoxS/CutS family)
VSAVPAFRFSATINGRQVDLDIPGDRLVIDLLRRDLGLTGTKDSCGIGVCGACSVLVDGQLMSACLLLAARVHGRTITTIEGLADGAPLSTVQDAFVRCGGFQCGFCTPGQMIAAVALLAENPAPTEHDVREWMSGNLCRCTGYRGIVDAVLSAAQRSDEDSQPNPQQSAHL